jgi:hypothetical protein
MLRYDQVMVDGYFTGFLSLVFQVICVVQAADNLPSDNSISDFMVCEVLPHLP